MFKNRSFLVKPVKDSDLENREPTPFPFSRVEALVHDVAGTLVGFYIVAKVVQTTCNAIEHVVVTKVK